MESIKINFGKYTALGSDWERGSNIEAKGGATHSSHMRALKPRWEGEETVGKSFKNRFVSSFPLLKSILEKPFMTLFSSSSVTFRHQLEKANCYLYPECATNRACFSGISLPSFLFSHIVSCLQLPNSNVLCIKP